LISEAPTVWTSAHRLRGIAYVYVRLKFNQDAFPGGIPNISAIVQGKKVLDTRTSTTAFPRIGHSACAITWPMRNLALAFPLPSLTRPR
jgi:hypothetical protein